MPRDKYLYLCATLVCLFHLQRTRAEVVLDGKFGAKGPLAGPNYIIPADVGSTRGTTLFHSLSKFEIAKGESATFTGPSNIQNVLARVTGSSASAINGPIRSEISGANLFLINPNGILFGPGASVEVSGSFAASTANYLRLADGARFVAAIDADDSVLSSAPVSGFGFLGTPPGDISVNGSHIAVPEGRVISLLAGNIETDGAQIHAPDGQIRLGAMHQQSGELPANASLPDLSAGAIAVRHGSKIDASGNRGGRVVIRGGRLMVENSSIESNTLGTEHGDGINIAMADSVEILNGGQIHSLSPDALGPGGNIEVSARTIRLDGGGLANEFGQPITDISSSSGNWFSEGAQKGGDISLRAGRLEVVNSSRISSDSFGAGDAGRIQIEAGTVLLDGKVAAGVETVTQISADSLGFQGGKGGDITIRSEQLDVLNGASISSWTVGSAPAGLIDINTRSLNIINGSYVGSPTLAEGQAGDIHITADRLRIDGEESGIVAFTAPGEFPASGGNVQIKSDSLELLHGAFIVTSSFGAGQGGNIDISTRALTLNNEATINAAGYGAGRAGNISLNAAGSILLANGSSVNTSAPESSGGNISIRSGSEIRLFSSEISALAGLNGGNVSLQSPSLVYLHGSTITGQADAIAGGSGNGGNLGLAPYQLVLKDSALISKSSFGNGGNISILADYFFASGSAIDASAPFGLPGDVRVTAPELDLSGIYLGLPVNLLDASTLLRPDCGVRLGGNISSFIVLGRGGLPLEPGGFVPSPLPLENRGVE